LITANTQVEELMDLYPETITYFIINKVSLISCAGAYPTTLGEMMSAKKVKNIAEFIDGLNDLVKQKKQKVKRLINKKLSA
jgi:hypothetical protein